MRRRRPDNYRSENWGDRDDRRGWWWIAVMLIASAVVVPLWLIFGIGENLLVWVLSMLFIMVMGIAVPVVMVIIGVIIVMTLINLFRWITKRN